jgi:hypothetical protein
VTEATVSATAVSAASRTQRRGSVGIRHVLLVEWDRTLAWLLVAGGGVTLLCGQRNLAASPFGAEQVAYLISGGLGALLLVFLGMTALLAADLRDEQHKLARLESAGRGEPYPDPRTIAPLAITVPAGRTGSAPGMATGVRRWQFALSAASVVMAAGLLVGGWARAATTGDLNKALAGLVLALVGMVVAVAGCVGYLTAARRRVVRRRRVVVDGLQRRWARSDESAVGGDAETDTLVWTVAGLRRFHRSTCPALACTAGQRVVVNGVRSSLEPCLICLGDDLDG